MADAPALGVIGPATYAASYGYLWDDPLAFSEQLHTFSADAFRDFISRESTRLWIAEMVGKPVGFLAMVTGSPEPITFEGNGGEIARIYLLPGAQGCGLGRMLIEAAESEARKEDLKYAWLDVMASASTAIETYRRWGFVDIGTKLFPRPVRKGFHDMVVFRKALSTA
ncbi:GNAT family N-acetyltransferase [Sinorhizobium meliloti]|uniref:GNAT family N-acetyltransferase n=1 Tax=Rhizobium meliloti TaxID=382 RepID=UPI003F17595A